jgi:hypothetical protein
MDQGLSLLLFIAMLVEFITVERAGTSTFLNLLALSLVVEPFSERFRVVHRKGLGQAFMRACLRKAAS